MCTCNCRLRKSCVLSVFSCTLLIGCRLLSNVASPLWLDALQPSNSSANLTVEGYWSVFSVGQLYAGYNGEWYEYKPQYNTHYYDGSDENDGNDFLTSIPTGTGKHLENFKNNDGVESDNTILQTDYATFPFVKAAPTNNNNSSSNHKNSTSPDIATIPFIKGSPSVPLFSDSPLNNDVESFESNHNNGTSPDHLTFPFFIALLQSLVPCMFWTSVLLVIRLGFPHQITDFERRYPKRLLVIPGFAQALSTMLVNYASSGARTAPYLQAIINNFNIPIQFTARLILLRKWPTRRKLLCAVTVMMAECVCLLPVMVPGLETPAQRQHDGGAKGAGAILWPMCFVSSMIPYVIANSLMEQGVKDATKKADPDSDHPAQTDPDPDPDYHRANSAYLDPDSNNAYPNPDSDNTVLFNSQVNNTATYTIQNSTAAQNSTNRQLHMAYYLSWYCSSLSFGICCLFWMDLIPGFGTSTSIHHFWSKLQFNVSCIVGAAGCGPSVYILGWLVVLANFGGFSIMPVLLRYSEGANFMIVAQALRSPLLFLFWTLFVEHPFHFGPHVSLSTWLSIAALVLMLPAVIVYNIGAPENIGKKKQSKDPDTRPLIIDSDA